MSSKSKISLLSSSGSESDSDSSSASSTPSDSKVTKLTVNKKYAKSYQSSKRAQSLRSARSMGFGTAGDEDESDGDESSSSSSSDDDAHLLTDQVDLKILKTINAIRSKDPKIYDKRENFFNEDGVSENDDDSSTPSTKEKSKKDRKMYYKDVVRQEVLEDMKKNGDQSDDDEYSSSAHNGRGERALPTHRLAYDDEQKAIRQEFINGDDSDSDPDSDDDLLLKKKSKTSSTADDQITKSIQEEYDRLNDKQKQQTQTTVDPRGEIQDPDAFLRDFMKDRKWVDVDGKEFGGEFSSDDDGDDDEKGTKDGHPGYESDEEELERADRFESKYNFRFEEEGSGAIVSYARGTGSSSAAGGPDASLRRPDERRKLQREKRREKKKLDRLRKEEELKRLKNEKREELREQMRMVQEIAGGSAGQEDFGGYDGEYDGEYYEEQSSKKEKSSKKVKSSKASSSKLGFDEATMKRLLESDFDPDEFDSAMHSAYGEDYYEADEDDQQLKPQDIIGDELDDTGYQYDQQNEEEQDYDGDDYDDGKDGTVGNDDDENDDNDDGEDGEEKNLRLSEINRKTNEILDSLYSLDYEDMIGDLPTRFKYRKVEANDYGLSAREILLAKDSDLSGYVSLKKMVPYREREEFKVGGNKRRKFREMLKKQEKELIEENGGGISKESVNEQQEEVAQEPKKKKRRQKKKPKGEKEGEGEKEAGVLEDGVSRANIPKADVPKVDVSKAKTAEAEGVPQDHDLGAVAADTETETVKKKRKKKGVKKSKEEKALIALQASQQQQQQDQPKETTTPATLQKNGGENDGNDDEKNRKKREKKRKRKAKGIGEIEAKTGLSKERLAAFGL